MRSCFGRRRALGAVAALWAAPGAAAGGPLAVRVTSLERDGRALCERPWLEAQWAEVTRLFTPAGVPLELRPTRPLPGVDPAIMTREARDAFAGSLEAKAINVFAIESLADVDEPGRLRKGVHWRPSGRADLHYVLIIASAPRGVLAHELGHFFGLPHAGARDNLMSYSRSEGGTLFLDRGQKARLVEGERAVRAELAAR
jgi:hypothetical protein